MKKDSRPIWEQHGITIKEYAETFNKVSLGEPVEMGIFGLDIKNPVSIKRICNIQVTKK